MSTIRDRIRHLRLENGLTQKQLANTLNISRSMVANWETGRSQPHIGDLDRLAGVLETTAEYLLSGSHGVRTDDTGVLVQDSGDLSFLGILSGDALYFRPLSEPQEGMIVVCTRADRMLAGRITGAPSGWLLQTAVSRFESPDSGLKVLGEVVRVERYYRGGNPSQPESTTEFRYKK